MITLEAVCLFTVYGLQFTVYSLRFTDDYLASHSIALKKTGVFRLPIEVINCKL